MKTLLAVLALVAAGGLFAWRMEAASRDVLTRRYALPAAPLAIAPQPAMAAQGARLAHLNGCFTCHGEGLRGHVELAGWFGTRLVAPNLTTLAHRQTPDQLAAAMRFGVKPDGTSLLAMPAHRFLTESDADNAAMIAYLRALPPAPSAAGDTHWGFGGRVMLALGLIPTAADYTFPADRGPRLTPTAPMALGQYLTHTQCTACHGGDLGGEAEEHSPDLRFAIQHYSLAAFERFFRTGTGRLGHGTQTMTPLIKTRLHYLTPDEVRAIFLYLQNSKPQVVNDGGGG